MEETGKDFYLLLNTTAVKSILIFTPQFLMCKFIMRLGADQVRTMNRTKTMAAILVDKGQIVQLVHTTLME